MWACGRSMRCSRVGRGQRLGLFAGSGVGKSTLLGMMTRYTRADVIVVGPDRRARPRGEGVRRGQPGPGGPRAVRRGRNAVRLLTAPAHPRRLARDGHSRALPRPGLPGAAAHGLADALRPGPARDRPRHRRTAGNQGLSAVRLLPGCRSWSSGPAPATRAAARSRPSTRCSRKATTRTIRSSTRPGQSSTATSCCRGTMAESGIYPPINVEVVRQPFHEPDRVTASTWRPPRSSGRSSPATCATGT